MIEKSAEPRLLLPLVDVPPATVARRVESLPSTAGPWSPGRPARRASRGPAGPCRRAARGGHRPVIAAASRGAARAGAGRPAGRDHVGRCARAARSSWSTPSCTTWRAPRRWPRPAPGCSRAGDGPARPTRPLAHGPHDGAAHAAPGRLARRLPRRRRVALDHGLADRARARRGLDAPPAAGRGRGTTPVQRLLACVDSASGVSAASTCASGPSSTPSSPCTCCARPWASGSAWTPRPPWAPARSAWPRQRRTTSGGWSPGPRRRCWCAPALSEGALSPGCAPERVRLLELVGELEEQGLAAEAGGEHHPLRQAGGRGGERQGDRPARR